MLLNELKPVSFNILESASEMVRILRNNYENKKDPQENIDQKWDLEHVAKFCAALEKIERVVSKQISSGKLDTALRDIVFSILVTADFDHDQAIQKIIKQSHDQNERIEYWKEIIGSGNVDEIKKELDRVGRDLSALVSQLRSKGATLDKSVEAPKPMSVSPDPVM